MRLNQVMVANSAIKWLAHVAGYMTEKNCLGLVLGLPGVVNSPVGEG